MATESPLPSSDHGTTIARSATEIRDWLVNQLAQELQVDPQKIKVDQPILAQGVDSMHAVAIVAKLEDWLGVRFTSDPWEEAPSIEALAQSLARGDDDKRSGD